MKQQHYVEPVVVRNVGFRAVMCPHNHVIGIFMDADWTDDLEARMSNPDTRILCVSTTAIYDSRIHTANKDTVTRLERERNEQKINKAKNKKS